MSDEDKKPIINLVTNDPEQAAAIAKLVTNHIRSPQRDTDGNRKTTVPNTQLYRTSLVNATRKKIDAEATLKLLPDVIWYSYLTSCISHF